MKKLWKCLKSIFCDNEIYIRAGALTYFTLSGIIPFCIFFIWIEEVFMVHTSVADLAEGALPNINDIFISFGSYPQMRMDQLMDSCATIGVLPIGRIVVIILITLFVYFFLNNLHSSFNHIWKSPDRTECFWKCLGFNIVITLIIIVIVLVTAWLYGYFNTPGYHAALAVIMMVIIVYLAYRFIPYGKHPNRGPSIVSALSASLCLYIWSSLIPLVGDQLSEFKLNGIAFLLLIFWMYWGWFIVLTGARWCAYLSKRGMDYMVEEVNELAPIYRLHLLILVASYIFKNAKAGHGGSIGLSHKNIRNGIIDELPAGMVKDRDSFLPMILLDSLIEELCRKKIIQNYRKEKMTEQRFIPYIVDIEDEKMFTVGDMIFRLNHVGGYDLKFPYYCVYGDMRECLSSSYLNMYCGMNQKLVDLSIGSLRNDVGNNNNIYENMEVRYSKCKESITTKHLEDYYREQLKTSKVDEIIESIRRSPDTAHYEPSREFHIQIIHGLAAQMSGCDELVDTGNSIVTAEGPTVSFSNKLKTSLSRLFGIK